MTDLITAHVLATVLGLGIGSASYVLSLLFDRWWTR